MFLSLQRSTVQGRRLVTSCKALFTGVAVGHPPVAQSLNGLNHRQILSLLRRVTHVVKVAYYLLTKKNGGGMNQHETSEK